MDMTGSDLTPARRLVQDFARQVLSGPHQGLQDRSDNRTPHLVVVDTNVLRGEVLTRTRTGKPTAMLRLASVGVLLVLTPAHVVEEVDEHLPRWCNEKGLDLGSAAHVWANDVLPWLQVVDAPAGLLTPTETARIDILRGIDTDDIPTAELALATGARLLSHDKALVRAVYGTCADLEAHSRYLTGLLAAGQAYVLELAGTSSVWTGIVAFTVAAEAVKWATSRSLGLPAAAATAALVLIHPERARNVGANFARKTGMAIGYVAAFALVHAEARAAFQQFPVPPTPGDLDESIAVRRDAFCSSVLPPGTDPGDLFD